MNKSYDDVKRDYKFLESVAIGGDLVEVDASVFDLMESPTKKKAAELYELAINQWFKAIGSSIAGIPEDVLENTKVARIAEKYGHASDGMD